MIYLSWQHVLQPSQFKVELLHHAAAFWARRTERGWEVIAPAHD